MKLKLKYTSWNNISIKKYYDIVRIMKEYENTPERQIIPLLSLLYETPEEEIGKLQIGVVKSLISKVSWINSFSFDKENKIDKIEVNGIKCKVKYNLSNFSYKQFLDYNEAQNNLANDITYLPNVLATFLIPDGKEYDDGYEMQEWIDTIEEYLPITTCQSLLFFSLVESKQLLERTITSLESKETKKMMMKAKLKIK